MPMTNIFSTRPLIGEDDDRKKTQQQQQQTNAEAAAATPAATTPAATPPATQDAGAEYDELYPMEANNYVLYHDGTGKQMYDKIPDGYTYHDYGNGKIALWDADENEQMIYGPRGVEWRRGQDDEVGDTGDDYSDMIDEGDKFDVNDEGDEEGKKKAKRNHFVPDNTPTAEDVNMRNTDLVEMPQGSKEGVPTQPGKFGGVVEPDEDKWDRMMREEKEKYEAGKAQLMELLRETESEEDKKKRERRERAGRIASGIGDMTSALANLVFTAKGGPNAYTGKDTLSEASRERYERLKKEREADETYNAKVRTALENWEKDYRALLQKMEAAKDTRDAKAADLAEKKRHNTKMEEEAANRNRITEEENKRKAQAQANKPVKQSKPRTSTSSSQSGGKKKTLPGQQTTKKKTLPGK